MPHRTVARLAARSAVAAVAMLAAGTAYAQSGLGFLSGDAVATAGALAAVPDASPTALVVVGVIAAVGALVRRHLVVA